MILKRQISYGVFYLYCSMFCSMHVFEFRFLLLVPVWNFKANLAFARLADNSVVWPLIWLCICSRWNKLDGLSDINVHDVFLFVVYCYLFSFCFPFPCPLVFFSIYSLNCVIRYTMCILAVVWWSAFCKIYGLFLFLWFRLEH